MVRYDNPSCPFPRFECMDAALALSIKCTLAMVLYVGIPMTGETPECGKPDMMLSSSEGMTPTAVR